MNKIADFFIPENSVENLSEDDYKQVEAVISTLKACARMVYQSIYVIDYFQQNFLYVSENPVFLCGLTSEEVKKKGYTFYFEYVLEDDLNMLLEINRAGFLFFNQTSVEDRLKLTISYDFHIRSPHGLQLINHKLTPIMLAENGNIWLAACVVSPSFHREAGHIEARMESQTGYWTYSIKDKIWKHEESITLDEREQEILLLTAQGLTMKEIGDKLYITESTIKYHKQSIFMKLCAHNISEALLATSIYKLI